MMWDRASVFSVLLHWSLIAVFNHVEQQQQPLHLGRAFSLKIDLTNDFFCMFEDFKSKLTHNPTKTSVTRQSGGNVHCC